MKSPNDDGIMLGFAMSSLHSNTHIYVCLSMHVHTCACREAYLNTCTQSPKKDSRGKGRLKNKIIPGWNSSKQQKKGNKYSVRYMALL